MHQLNVSKITNEFASGFPTFTWNVLAYYSPSFEWSCYSQSGRRAACEWAILCFISFLKGQSSYPHYAPRLLLLVMTGLCIERLPCWDHLLLDQGCSANDSLRVIIALTRLTVLPASQLLSFKITTETGRQMQTCRFKCALYLNVGAQLVTLLFFSYCFHSLFGQTRKNNLPNSSRC